MKVNGTRVEDLVGTGLWTKQRYVVPAWVTLLKLILTFIARAVFVVIIWTVRGWLFTVPAFALLVVYLRLGRLGLAVAVGALVWGLAAWAWLRPDSFSRLLGQRVRGAWRWKTLYGRHWHGAMDGTGLTRRTPDRMVYVPTVIKVRSTPVVDTLHLRLLHGQTPEELALQAEGLRHVYRAHRCKVVEDSPGRVRIVFYARDPLTATVRAIDPAGVPNLSGLPVGRAEDGEIYVLRLLGTHVLAAGATGSGKGSILWSTIRALGSGIACGLVRVTGIDPKGGMELFPGRPLFTYYADDSPEQMADEIEAAVERMISRKARLKAAGKRDFTPTLDDPFELIVIDEMAYLTAYLPDKKIRDRVAKALQLLLSQGRAVGFCVFAALQDPRKEVLPFRDLFPTRIALRLAEDSHVDMVLGDGALDRGAACHLIPASLPGVGFVHVEGAHEPVRVRFSYLTDDDITSMANRWAVGGASRVIDLSDPTVSPSSPYGRVEGSQP
jgi:DNA segregation ATPase FtsK/SpoIIIE, S-DNA-T family